MLFFFFPKQANSFCQRSGRQTSMRKLQLSCLKSKNGHDTTGSRNARDHTCRYSFDMRENSFPNLSPCVANRLITYARVSEEKMPPSLSVTTHILSYSSFFKGDPQCAVVFENSKNMTQHMTTQLRRQALHGWFPEVEKLPS